MKAAALRGALSDRARDGRVHVVDGLVDGDTPVDQGGAGGAARHHRAPPGCSWCSSARTSHLAEPAQRRQTCTCSSVDQLNTYDVLVSDDVVFTAAALDAFLDGAGVTARRPRRQSGHRAEASRRGRRDRRGGRQVSAPCTRTRATCCSPPVVCEKSYGLLDENKYTFLVRTDANKTEIKIAVEQVFNVTGHRRQHAQPRRQARRTRAGGASAPTPSGRSSASPRASASTSSAARSPDRARRTRTERLMGIRKYKPTTPGRRGSSVADFVEVTRSTPEKSLVRPLPKKGGRNNQGRITTRHQGGGHKRAYRVIDFRRYDKDGVPAKVAHIEYDPNRTARIALLHYADGEKRYIIAPNGLRQGDTVENGPRPTSSRATTCRCATSRSAPSIHAIELRPGGGAKIARSAGAACSSSPRRAPSPSCGCRPARCATSTCAAAPPSARSATPSSPTSTGARPAACAGRASARPYAVSP